MISYRRALENEVAHRSHALTLEDPRGGTPGRVDHELLRGKHPSRAGRGSPEAPPLRTIGAVHNAAPIANSPLCVFVLFFLCHDLSVLLESQTEAYKEGPQAYEFKGTNGFMLTFDMTSKVVPAALR